MIQPTRLISISRPLFQIPQLALVVGAALINPYQLSYITVVVILICTVPLGIIAYGINDVADRESDAINPRKGGLDGAILQLHESRQLARIIAIVAVTCCAVLAALGAYGASLAFGLLTSVSVIYSVRPLRLKSRPVLDSLANGIGVGLIFLMGYWAARTGFDLLLPSMPLFVCILLCAAAFHAYTTTADHEIDVHMHDRTTSVFFGKNTTIIAAASIYLLCAWLIAATSIWLSAYLLGSAFLMLSGLRYNSRTALRNIYICILLAVPIVEIPILLF